MFTSAVAHYYQHHENLDRNMTTKHVEDEVNQKDFETDVWKISLPSERLRTLKVLHELRIKWLKQCKYIYLFLISLSCFCLAFIKDHDWPGLLVVAFNFFTVESFISVWKRINMSETSIFSVCIVQNCVHFSFTMLILNRAKFSNYLTNRH